MFSLIAAISSSAYHYVFGPKKPDDDQEDEIAILEKALQARKEQESDPVSEDECEEGCFTGEGKITAITEEDVYINNDLICSIVNAPPNLTPGTKVRYFAYRTNDDKMVKVSRIENIIDDWQNEETVTSEQSDSGQNLSRVNKQKMMTKTLNEVVTRREERLVYAGDLTIDLNIVASDFVPLVGDSVKITALVAVDPESPDYSGQVVTVRRIEPNVSKYIIGTISNFDPDNKTGIVDMRIFFHRDAISVGYVPCVGDTVACDCIESRTLTHRWRALMICPLHKVKKSEVANITKHGIKLPQNINELEKNKNGVEVDSNLEVKLEMMREKELRIAVSNRGCVMRVIKKCSLTADKNQSQLRLVRPRENDQVNLMGGEVITYIFKVKGMFVGKSTELIQFHFGTFQIARLVTVIVRPLEVIRTRTSTGCTFNRNVQIRERDYDQNSRVWGVKPFAKAHFAVPNGVFRVNKELESLVIKIANSKMTAREAQNELMHGFPEFANTLNFATYKKNFHNLLFLEEIAMRINIQMYALESAIFNMAGEFLTVQVPGLAEKRPSLVVGDKVVAEYKFAKSLDNKKFEGYIHKIRNTEIYIKFNLLFHETYNREDCRVNFEASTIVLQRSHRAINAVYNNLGINFLFPARVTQKEPQYTLREIDSEKQPKKSSDETIKTYINREDRMKELMELIEDLNDEDKVKVCQQTFKTKTLQWYNEKLNEYQKEAVKNILTGIARPLPYIIFGPPGTGKTNTIVETVLQIFTLITDSRILIATPSNSSANLIAERLLDYNVLKPGDLVRLVANYYMISDAIPDRLRPYCATADLTSANSNGIEFETTYQADSVTRCLNVIQLGRHRIIIGTCAALGILHNMGFKEGQFSHVLIDEAGQATEPECMIPLSFLDLETGQAILAGDPLQLGPVVISKLGDHFGFSQSFLFRLLQLFPYQRDTVGFKYGYDPRLVTKLLINYRSLPEMLQLPNDMFYDSELIPFIQYQGSKEAMLLERMRDDLPKRRGPVPAIVFHGVNGVNRQDDDSPSWYNCEEATQVYLYYLRLCEKKFTADDIGIITPYKKQVAEIRSLISGVDVEEIPKVGTVEEFQGQERNVIIVSTVRSMSDLIANDVKFTLGFVSAPQRLNVAITRARSLLIIIGNPGLLSQDPYWKSVLDYCTKRNCYTGCNWSPVIQDFPTPT